MISPTRGPVLQVNPPTRTGCCVCAAAGAVKASASTQAPNERRDFDIKLSDRLVKAMCGSLRGVRHRRAGSSAAVPVCHDMRPSAAGAMPAPAVPPIITVPIIVPIVPMDTGNGSGGRAYGCAAPATDGAANNGASQGALRKGLRERNRYRKTKQEQQDQASFHVALPHHSTRSCSVVSLSQHRASRAIDRNASIEVGQLYAMGPDALSRKTLRSGGEYTEGTLFASSAGKRV